LKLQSTETKNIEFANCAVATQNEMFCSTKRRLKRNTILALFVFSTKLCCFCTQCAIIDVYAFSAFGQIKLLITGTNFSSGFHWCLHLSLLQSDRATQTV